MHKILAWRMTPMRTNRFSKCWEMLSWGTCILFSSIWDYDFGLSSFRQLAHVYIICNSVQFSYSLKYRPIGKSALIELLSLSLLNVEIVGFWMLNFNSAIFPNGIMALMYHGIVEVLGIIICALPFDKYSIDMIECRRYFDEQIFSSNRYHYYYYYYYMVC